jgi:hypothetical protein
MAQMGATTIVQGGNQANVTAGNALQVDEKSVAGVSMTGQVAGSLPVTIVTGGNATADVSDGPVTPGTVATKSSLEGCQYNTTLPNPANTQQMAIQCDSFGRLIDTNPDVSGLLTQLVRLFQSTVPMGTGAQQVKLIGPLGQLMGTTGMPLAVSFPVNDPCSGPKGNIAISQTANTRLAIGVNGRYRLCSIFVVGADAENLSLVEGTGATCGTSTTAVIGGTTAAAGPNLAANGGWVLGNGQATVAVEVSAGDDLCLFQSGSGRVAGNLTYAIGP